MAWSAKKPAFRQLRINALRWLTPITCGRPISRVILRCQTIKDLSHAQTEFDAFRKMYNEDRPHCSFSYAVPADRYKISDRAMPEKVLEWQYPPYCHVRRVRGNGYMRFAGMEFFISEAFYDLNIAFADSQEDGVVDIIYRNFRIARLDLRNKSFASKKIAKLK